MAEYANHDKVIGNFIGTFLNGYGIYLFGASGNSRCGIRSLLSITSVSKRRCHGRHTQHPHPDASGGESIALDHTR